jgi:hypothetical protein
VLTCHARFIFIMARLLFREEFDERIWKIWSGKRKPQNRGRKKKKRYWNEGCNCT